jgi:CheY-like chemotaxis protein
MTKNIFVVDDNASIRALLRSLLEEGGLTVCGEASAGIAAIDAAVRCQPDLILLDYSMKGLNGAEAASLLKARLPNVPIILFTLHADDMCEPLKRSLGVDLVISKAEAVSTLVQSIRMLTGLPETEPSLGPLRLATGDEREPKLKS